MRTLWEFEKLETLLAHQEMFGVSFGTLDMWTKLPAAIKTIELCTPDFSILESPLRKLAQNLLLPQLQTFTVNILMVTAFGTPKPTSSFAKSSKTVVSSSKCVQRVRAGKAMRVRMGKRKRKRTMVIVMVTVMNRARFSLRSRFIKHGEMRGTIIAHITIMLSSTWVFMVLFSMRSAFTAFYRACDLWVYLSRSGYGQT